ncbi:CvpA family protein [Aquibacillus albus]|uniref:Membrane protein required for colicin V production n=1 Tax=Aquibacillus albus TaxID=1168171 RepID=A0ABS2N1G5_9BACI|nr:CvpA family protein [Aquibacillus albus]MBM7571976.1 putative membrane protein required for colicin V production [Aquibacillus albus]
MIDLILLGILLLGFLIGLKRGFILQLLHLLGFIVAFIVAVIYYDDLAEKLDLWIPYPDLPEDATWAIFLETLPLESAFYNGVSFALLFFITKIVLQIIASMLDFVADLPILNVLNGWLGAILGFIETYCILFIFLYIIALAPIGFIQEMVEGSSVAAFIVERTPFISKQINSLWFEHISSLMHN